MKRQCQEKEDMLLSIRDLEAGYGAFRILNGVTLDIRKGALAVIIGPNGSGKSTVIKSVFGLTTPFGGSIRFRGEEITKMQTHRVIEHGIGYVPQGRLVFESLSVEENLTMGAYGLPADVVAKRRTEVLKLFPALRAHLGQQASFLSGGQQQQLSIGRALMKKPSLLLLDEPSLGLDPKTQQHVFKTLERINKDGVTILMVEQNALQALRICTEAHIIKDGKVALSGGPELARQKKVQELYLGGA